MGRSQSIKKIIFSLLILFASFVSFAAVTKVSSLDQSTIDAARPYDTLLVEGGNYKLQELKITRPLVLRGLNKPVLDGGHQHQLILIFGSDVTIEGFDIRNGGRSGMYDLAAIKISQARNVSILNNVFTDMFFAIYFQESVACTVKGNTVVSNAKNEVQSGNGIHCWKCDSMTISGNDLSGNRDGIYFEFVTHSHISDNKSHDNIRYGLHFMFSHNNSYTNNTFDRNGAGVAVMYTKNVIMKNNVFSHNWGSAAYGILLKEISDSEIISNTFLSNTAAIYMEGTNRVTVKENLFMQNGCALRMQASCDGNIVKENNFKSNTFDVTTNGNLIQNEINGNYWDKYEGYDLNRDGIGDVPYHPVSLYSMIIERIPVTVVFMRSFLVNLMDKTEKAIPGITPENFMDERPVMKPFAI